MQVAFSALVGYNVIRGKMDRRMIMKKRLSILTVVMMVMSLFAGCGSDAGKALHEMKVEKYVTLGEYTGLNVTVPLEEVEAQVQNYLWQMSYYGMMTVGDEDKIVNREVTTGDLVNIDYAGYKDDVAFEGGTASDQLLLIGSGTFIDGFEEGLIGVNPGETVDLDLAFPEGYQNEELAGQDVVFTVTVNYIYDSSEEYDAYYQMLLENVVLEAFMKQCVFTDIPEELVNRYKTNLQNSITAEAEAAGADIAYWCNYRYGMDLTTFLDTYAPESAKQSLAFQAVANEQDLNLTDEELDAKISEAATANGYTSVEEFMGTNTKDDYREYFTYEVAVEYLVNNAVVTTE